MSTDENAAFEEDENRYTNDHSHCAPPQRRPDCRSDARIIATLSLDQAILFVNGVDDLRRGPDI